MAFHVTADSNEKTTRKGPEKKAEKERETHYNILFAHRTEEDNEERITKEKIFDFVDRMLFFVFPYFWFG